MIFLDSVMVVAERVWMRSVESEAPTAIWLVGEAEMQVGVKAGVRVAVGLRVWSYAVIDFSVRITVEPVAPSEEMPLGWPVVAVGVPLLGLLG